MHIEYGMRGVGMGYLLERYIFFMGRKRLIVWGVWGIMGTRHWQMVQFELASLGSSSVARPVDHLTSNYFINQ